LIVGDTCQTSRITVEGMLVEAVGTVSANLLPIAKIAAFPMVLWLVLPPTWTALGPYHTAAIEWICTFWPFGNSVWFFFITAAVGFLCKAVPLALFCSHWLQFLLRPSASVTSVLLWSRRDRRFLRHGLLLFTVQILFGVAEQALVYMTYIGTGIMDAVVANPLLLAAAFLLLLTLDAWVIGRSAPVFAAAAAGQRMTLPKAWAITKGQTLRLMLLVVMLLRGPLLVGYLLQAQIESASLALADNPVLWGLIQLPLGLVHCIALALIAVPCLRLYAGNRPEVPAAILERFD